MKVIRIGVDLAKNVFQVHGVDRFEKPVWRKKLSRTDWIDLPPLAVPRIIRKVQCYKVS
jgi:hypothetical protein